MKLVLLFLSVVSLSHFALAADPTEAQIQSCIPVVEKAVAKTAEALGMGKGVGHMGGVQYLEQALSIEMEAVESEMTGLKFPVLYNFGGGVLASDTSEGYMPGTGATATVLFEGNTCKVVNMNVSTGADFFSK